MPPKAMKILLRILLWRPQLSHLMALMACLLLSIRLNHILEYFADDQGYPNEKSPLNLGQPVFAETTQGASQGTPKPPEEQTIKEPPKEPKDVSSNGQVSAPPKQPEDPAHPSLEPVSHEASQEEKKDNGKKEDTQVKFDPLSLDENQVRVFKALSDRHDKLGQQSEHLEQQQKLIELGDKKLSEQIKTLQDMKKSLEEAKQSLTKEEENNLNKMVKIYEGMKPEEAAEILNKMHVVVVAKLVQGMAQKKAAPILASMDKNKARMVTLEMIRPKETPHTNESDLEPHNQSSSEKPKTPEGKDQPSASQKP